MTLLREQSMEEECIGQSFFWHPKIVGFAYGERYEVSRGIPIVKTIESAITKLAVCVAFVVLFHLQVIIGCTRKQMLVEFPEGYAKSAEPLVSPNTAEVVLH